MVSKKYKKRLKTAFWTSLTLALSVMFAVWLSFGSLEWAKTGFTISSMFWLMLAGIGGIFLLIFFGYYRTETVVAQKISKTKR